MYNRDSLRVEVKVSQLALAYRYDAVRYSPISNHPQPFQILASLGPNWAIVELSRKEAQDLHNALGVMLTNTEVEDA